MTDYPEHKKQRRSIEEGHSQAIGEFIDWLLGQGIHLVRWGTNPDDPPLTCAFCNGTGLRWQQRGDGSARSPSNCSHCGGTGQRAREGWLPDTRSPNRLLADYFEIDLAKIEDEKRAMLESIRAANA